MKKRTIKRKTKTAEISLKELLIKTLKWYYYLRTRQKLILVMVLTGGVMGFAYAWLKKPVYIAASTFVLEDDDKNKLGQYAGLAAMAGLDLNISGNAGGIFEGDNIIELYKSSTMIEKTLLTSVNCFGHKELLIDRYIDFNRLRKKWDNKPALRSVQFKGLDPEAPNYSRLQDSVLADIVNDIKKKYLSVSKPDKKLNIIKAEVKTKDEFFSKAFDEEIVKKVNDFYLRTKTKRMLANVMLLQKKADSIRSMMYRSIYSAAAVTDATPNLNLARQVQRTAPLRRSEFSAETNKEILAELVKNLEMSKITLQKETPLIQLIDRPKYPLEKKELGLITGTLLGMVLSLFLTVVYLTIKKILSTAIKEIE